MDRDRDRRRDREIPPEDQYGTGRGQSYRPGNTVRERSPPRMDSYRARTPTRRPEYGDSYKADSYRAPPRPRSRSPPRRDEYRRRSPSPRYRDREPPRGGDSYRGRPRSPPRREDLPRDDLFRRDPVRDERDYRDIRDLRDDRDRAYAGAAGRSPLHRFRDRSAGPLKRTREPSPVSSRGRRSPPPAKRERLVSPPRGAGRYDDYPPSRGVSPPRRRYSPDPRDRRPSPPRGPTREYRPRSRSPPARNDRVDPRTIDDWRRPRSPVREPRQEYLSRDDSGVNSNTTSRRSSPPVHPSRVSLHPAADDRPRSSRVSPRDPYGDEREPYRASDVDSRLPPSRDPAYDDDRRYAHDCEPVPPPREPRHGDDTIPTPRAPPTGPSAQRGVAMSPPTGPAASTPSGPRAAGAPPAGPRGGPAPRGDFAGRGRGGFGGDFAPRGRGFGVPFRGGRGGGPGPGFGRGDSGFGRGDSSFGRNEATFARNEATFSQPDPAFGNRPPPSGPRGSFSQAPAPAFRQNSNATATTYPRTQRFGNGDTTMPDAPTGPKAARRPTEPAIALPPLNRPHPALADLPKLIDGGQPADPLIDQSKLHKLEDEAEKLRRQIDEKETKKRKSLREWDRLRSETEMAGLRSELAEQALKQLNGEAESQAAF
ncbi:hypothetical protein M409DRAFT_53385 [Zasmidium cellare ATCC 36951]|uniref:Uncharacterized protein n=1 Tax=Zasmidium cellare ATCC 36951 TaxID=1080233 RepID=A0A6A6CQG2_ZASCE|nr:uncharacterized protein M409DRAFT_53385 [Zasmidium cellare ATCC 36951]KAF2168062.1 hypothetical protein M409DRAFT_53385 [Zasmidium cellare ATCC 36951]